MDRIAIVGCAGGGKSTLARGIAARLDLPLVHLDRLFWRPGWRESDEPGFRARLGAALAGGRWIADGNYARVGDLHLAGAQVVVWVDQARPLCVRRALARAIRGRGRTRADMADGCVERIDPAFLHYVWRWRVDTRPGIEAALARHAPGTPLVRLTDDREIAAWLGGLAPP